MDVVRTSKRLSYVLRHRPGSVGITLDAAGWVDAEVLLAALSAHGLTVTREQLERVVDTNDKRRFEFDETGTRIRASQGHSVPVELGSQPETPETALFHGVAEAALPSILAHGLRPGRRHAVHLSPDPEPPALWAPGTAAQSSSGWMLRPSRWWAPSSRDRRTGCGS